jgi:hypothetical protein
VEMGSTAVGGDSHKKLESKPVSEKLLADLKSVMRKRKGTNKMSKLNASCA